MRLTQRFAPGYMIVWQGAGERCALDLQELNLPIAEKEALAILQDRGFKPLEVDLVQTARMRCEVSSYKRGAQLAQAPGVLDCSTLIWWVYRQRGIELPRYSIHQRQVMVDSGIWSESQLHQAQPGDVIFVRGRHPYYLTDPEDGVGHVGIMTGDGTVIHAANSKRGIVEDPLNAFIKDWSNFRGIGRVIPADHRVITLEAPPGRIIRWSIDISCMILQ